MRIGLKSIFDRDRVKWFAGVGINPSHKIEQAEQRFATKIKFMIMSLAQQNRFLNPASGGTFGMTRGCARRDDMSILIVISNALHPRSGPFGKGTSEKSFKAK